jgi:hypothetical protein
MVTARRDPPDPPKCTLCRGEMSALPVFPSYGPHYRCQPCKVVWLWTGSEWLPCQAPEDHCSSYRFPEPTLPGGKL